MGDATKALSAALERHVGPPRREVGYREAAPDSELAGTWLGFIEQPGVALRGKTTTEVTLFTQARDEWGTATIAKLDDAQGVVAFRKTYVGRDEAFVYRGRVVDGMLLGTWHWERNPGFAGTFALVKASALSAERQAAARRTIPRRSWRRGLFRAAIVVVPIAMFGLRCVRIPGVSAQVVVLAVALSIVLYVVVSQLDAKRMKKRVEDLRRELGTSGSLSVP